MERTPRDAVRGQGKWARRAATVALAAGAGWALSLAGGCASGTASASGSASGSGSGSGDRGSIGVAFDEDGVMIPGVAQPAGSRNAKRPPATLAEIDLTEPDAVVWTTIDPIVVDTRDFPVQVQDIRGITRLTKEILPEHRKPNAWRDGVPNALVAGGLMEQPTARGITTFTGLDRTGWTPPDPAIAVGPNHVVQVVNQSLAFYTKSGTLQFQAILGSQGNPGFFEDVGAEGFAFDPKCFYDHYAGRFIVLALEVYGSFDAIPGNDEAYVTIAVSDDSDPNGVWYKYRTDAITTISGLTYWWDYPGLGYDDDAWYVTSNLFAFDFGAGGFGNVGYRIFNKTSMLSGGPALFATLRDPAAGSVQVAQHFGNNQSPYFVSVESGSSLRINAITNPLTNPRLQTTSVTVPGFNNTAEAPVAGGGLISNVDFRIMNVHWRDGQLYAAHTANLGGENKARWYHMATNNWPASGGVSLVQSGQIDPGPGIFTFFPAIYADANQNIGLVFGQSSADELVSMRITGRQPTNPLGEMGDPVVIRTGTRSGTQGRWGDYYDMAIDPSDGTTFWAVGQTDESGIGWDTWINSFSIVDVGFGITLDLVTEIPQFVSPNTAFTVDFTVDLGTDTLVGTPVLFAGPEGQSPQGFAATLIGPNSYRATVPGFDCETTIAYQIAAIGQMTGTVTLPANGGSYVTSVGDLVVAFADNAESDQGYTVSGNATDGQWTRGVPAGDGSRGDPTVDGDGSGSAWLTDNVPGNSDVDLGDTILTSPAFDFTGGGTIDFFYWFDDGTANNLSNNDGLFIETSNDGSTWLPAFAVNTAAPFWRDDRIIVEAADAGPSFQFRVIARDATTGSLVEAGIDGIEISNLGCSDCVADFDGNGTVNVFDIIAFLAVWDAQGPGSDFDDNGTVNVFDIIAFLGAWDAGCP